VAPFTSDKPLHTLVRRLAYTYKLGERTASVFQYSKTRVWKRERECLRKERERREDAACRAASCRPPPQGRVRSSSWRPPRPKGGYVPLLGDPRPKGGFVPLLGDPRPKGGFVPLLGDPRPKGGYVPLLGDPRPSGGYVPLSCIGSSCMDGTTALRARSSRSLSAAQRARTPSCTPSSPPLWEKSWGTVHLHHAYLEGTLGGWR
jgi:hypothetical protein